MRSVLVQLDDTTHQLLNRVAPAGKRKRAQFIRDAILKAIIEAEEARTRAAYRKRPDSDFRADDWSNAEDYR